MRRLDDQRLLERALAVVGRPVVTLGGRDVAQVRDVLFTRDGTVPGFTLAGRGIFAGPVKRWLPWSAVHGFGPDAILVRDERALTTTARPKGRGGVVIGDEVLTRSGTVVGTVVDAVLRLEATGLDVVGYEIRPSSGEGTRFVPLPDTLSVTGGRLVVPDEAIEFLATDLAGVAAAVDTFRARLSPDQRAAAPPPVPETPVEEPEPAPDPEPDAEPQPDLFGDVDDEEQPR